MSTDLHTVTISGKFDGYFSGSSVGQGEGNHGYGEGGDVLHARYQDATRIRRGRGYSLRIDRLSVDAVAVLAEYADVCIVVNSDGDSYSDDYAEKAAALKVLDVCRPILRDAGWDCRAGSWFPPEDRPMRSVFDTRVPHPKFNVGDRVQRPVDMTVADSPIICGQVRVRYRAPGAGWDELYTVAWDDGTWWEGVRPDGLDPEEPIR